MTWNLRLLICILTVASSSVFAQIGGTTIFNSLNIQPSARIAAMGGSFIAAKDGDVNIAGGNPSAMDSTMHRRLAFSYVDYFTNTNFGHAAYVHQWKKDVTVGATMQFISHGEMTEYDPLGNELGAFKAGEFGLTLGAAYQYDSLWSLGANFKTFYSSISYFNSLAFAADFAATYHRPDKKLIISGVIKNIGYQVKSFTTDTREKLPFEMQVGITKQPRHAPFRFSLQFDNIQKWDLTYINSNEASVIDPITGQIVQEKNFVFGDKLMRHITLGTEFLLGESFQLRAAYNYRRRVELATNDRPGMSGFSFGLGFRVKKIDLSYGRAIYSLAGPSNHFTFGFRI